jgi:sugar (pentulose or hexulose) kinase
MQGVISVDVGSTSMRSVLYDAAGRAHHTEQRASAPAYGPGGRVEQDANTWREGLTALLSASAAAAAAQRIEPACIAVTAQRSSVLPVDAAGTPLHPALMWQDTRGAGLAREYAEHVPQVYQRTGLRISPVFSAIKMAWLRRERPAVWRATHKLLGVQDWVLWLLTGRFVTDQSLASRTNLLNLEARVWDDEMLALFEVPRSMLCELVPPGATVGGLGRALAEATSLREGLPVVSAGGDQQCAALGLGLLSATHAVANAGTGGYLIGHAAQPLHDPQMRISCNVSAVPGAFIVEAALLAAGSVHAWFGKLVPGDDARALEAEAAQVPPGCEGLVMLPHFEGAGSPHWDPQARGAFVHVDLHTTRGAMARAILEAVAIGFKDGLDVIESLCGPVGEVHVSGGMTRSALFNRIQCDVLERPLVRFAGNEATAQGAWIAGCVATGLARDHAQAYARLLALEPHERLVPDVACQPAYHLQRWRSHAAYAALAGAAVRDLYL